MESRISKSSISTKKLVELGILTALVIILQLLGSFIRFGPFSVSLVLVPVVLGGALLGAPAGAWLGFVFSVGVLFTDAGAFLAISVPGTIITVILKGTLAGLAAGIVYLALEKVNKYLACVVAAICAPIVNTGIFLIGCRLFFYETIKGWAEGAGFASAGAFMIVGLVGTNFLVEMAINIILSPTILRLVNLGKKSVNR